MTDLRTLILDWAREHHVSDGPLACHLQEIAQELLTVRTATGSLPPVPTQGIVCRGHWWVGGTMRWRALRLSDHTVLFDNASVQGSINVAEFLAIMDTLKLCDRDGEPGPIYSASFVACKWIRDREFNTSQQTPAEILEAVRVFNRTEYPRELVQYWNPEVWGPTPADYGARDYKQKWDYR